MATAQSEEKALEDLIFIKYKLAGEIVNRVLQRIIEKCLPEASVKQICEFGDAKLQDETSKAYEQEIDVLKGIAFPTCVSINHCICHFSPILNDPDVTLKDGDLVKINLGAHIDGCVAVVGHSLVIGASLANKVIGKKRNAMLAAYYGVESGLAFLRPGIQTHKIANAVQTLSKAYGCKQIEVLKSHLLKKVTVHSEKSVVLNPNGGQEEEHENDVFKAHDVYVVNVLVSTE